MPEECVRGDGEGEADGCAEEAGGDDGEKREKYVRCE